MDQHIDWTPVTRRARLLTHNIVPAAGKGLEFGALDNPTLTPRHGDIRYVDYTNTAGLRAHPHEASVCRAKIIDVTYVWPGSGSLADVIGSEEKFDYAIASQVIEHVPNVLGWFQGIHEVLRPGGIFNLAIPDRRFTFDICRRESTIAEAVEAYFLGYTRPSIRQMFDHTYEARAVKPGEKLEGDPAIPRYSADALSLAFTQAKAILETGRYFDSHCWVFTPASFLSLIELASELNLFPFVINDFWPTEGGSGEFEFFVSFRRAEPELELNLESHRMTMIRYIRSRLVSP